MVHKINNWVIFVAGLALLIYHTYYIVIGVPYLYVLACWHMMLICIVVFFNYSWTRSEGDQGWFDFGSGIVLSVLTTVSFTYLIINYADTIEAPEISLTGKIVGVIVTVLILEACRRAIGFPLPFIAFLFILYSRLGEYCPDVISTQCLPFLKIGEKMAHSNFGIFGTPLIVSSSIIFYFVLLGSFLAAAGALNFFTDLATSLTGRQRGGQAKAGVVASGFVAMISGSAVANVVMTGTVSIPMMKKAGYRPFYAGAVEAVASSGGQLAPPVMGAAAFIMSMYTGIQYRNICFAAAIPALLFYISLYIAVHIEAVKTGIRPLTADELPRIKDSLMESYNLIPIVILVYLIIAFYPPALCAFYAMVATLVIGFVKNKDRLTVSKIVEAIKANSKAIAPVSCACAVAGIVVGVISLTGLGLVISSAIINLSGGSKLILLVLTAITSLILGMGLPTSACYIILAILVAPAMVKMGIPLISAHLFVFYYGIISAITPPVALAAYAAAGIAGSDPSKTGFTAVKIGIATYLIPVLFYYNAGVVGLGGYLNVIWSIGFSVMCVIAIQCLITNYTLFKNSLGENVSYLVQIPLFMVPNNYAKMAAIVLFFINIAFSYMKRTKGGSPAVA
jgi:TRAP transporter 4TM/12TM fusion protein